MKQDVTNGVTYVGWTVYGKIDSINNGSRLITYTYDAAGNRITKTSGGVTSVYVRDAQGNILSIYNQTGSGSPTQQEVDLYGSSRLGSVRALTVAPTTVTLGDVYGTATTSTFTRGEKSYELTNHLGNVLSTVTDKKIAVVSGSNSSLIDHFTADIATAQDYYPFGMLMPGRTYTATTATNYRFGFNGKENDNEVKGVGDQIDYGMRYYDPRAGRFMSVDPLTKKYPELTPYQYASNTPIWALDLDGKEAWLYYDNLQGWKQSTVFGGPFTEAEANKVGFYSAAQVHKFQEELEVEQNKQDRFKHEEEVVASRNHLISVMTLPGLAYELSPVKTLYDATETAQAGHPALAAVMAGFAVSDFGALFNATGKSFAGIARGLAEKYSIEQTWKLHPLVRGILTEARLSSSVYKGFEWLGETAGPFFQKFDFYNASEGLAVSLKTVNADKNFDFKNILTNINQLAELKKAGATAQYGREFVIKNVRLDIAIPKGYDESVLNGVRQAAEAAKVPINIF